MSSFAVGSYLLRNAGIVRFSFRMLMVVNIVYSKRININTIWNIFNVLILNPKNVATQYLSQQNQFLAFTILSSDYPILAELLLRPLLQPAHHLRVTMTECMQMPPKIEEIRCIERMNFSNISNYPSRSRCSRKLKLKTRVNHPVNFWKPQS